MKYRVKRIERIINGVSTFEVCNLVVSDLERLRRKQQCDEVKFIYETE